MFAQAQNTTITGYPIFISHVNDRISEESSVEGMNILLQHVAKGAMHNSVERFDAPTCHPETRIALQDDVVGWVNEPPGDQLVTWMYGPAGAGKSAIAQTISQKLHTNGQLTASFFFFRTSTSKGRSDESAIIATLAYQLSRSAPATKSLIARTVRENPLIFDLSLDDQVQALIVTPLTVAYQDDADILRARVIVVDGLDECRKEDNAQSRVVRALIMGLLSIPEKSQKLFITSRPEHSIVAVFKGFQQGLVRKMELNDQWNPEDDIRTFLNSAFADIKRSHCYFESHSADQTWPSQADIDALVTRSSGQFIYASVVIKYIKSEDNYDPAARLKVVLQLMNNKDRPYAELDALYKYIFSQIRDVERVLAVLSLERVHSKARFGSPLELILSEVTGAHIEEIKFWLRPLVSVLVWGAGVIQYMHASLPDFLADESRSGTFCIYSTSITARCIRRALHLLEQKDTWTKRQLMPALLAIPRHYAKASSPQHKIHVYSAVSDFNVVKNVLSRIPEGPIAYDAIRAIGSYLEWILTESLESDDQGALVKPLTHIQTWIMECFSFNGLENTDKVDLWPFFTACPVVDVSSWASLETDKDIQLFNQAVFLHYLIPEIPQWLANTNFLGRYAITEERYVVALLRVSRYLMRSHQLGAVMKYQLAVVAKGDLNPDDLSASMLLAKETFSDCMGRIPESIELYFFVLFMCSEMVDSLARIGVEAAHSVPMVRSTTSYLYSTRHKLPFLRDPASPEYIQARENAEATWIETKKDLYDPIISIRVEQLPDLD
ncbi:hypothetical protein D9619_000212 [Psilocybe cf. subviscida]|uniref:NACHT domain-containing protein n=1 Tax=Psilocybe cf. subviscida TaxID=2480587 RepID=A0A8H5BGU6_9AGAR|nr:hypothetical protein D9619_000212 [Psilocybe cf. subviscida]